MGMYLMMYIHNPNYNATTNDTLLVPTPSSTTDPSNPPGYWRATSLPLSYTDATTAETNNTFNYALEE